MTKDQVFFACGVLVALVLSIVVLIAALEIEYQNRDEVSQKKIQDCKVLHKGTVVLDRQLRFEKCIINGRTPIH